jgi:putative chitinase
MDRSKFFAAIRQAPFGGTISQQQVDGCNAILDEWEKRGLTDLRWLAYMLATTKWETAHSMQPVSEYGRGRGHPYGRPDPETGRTYYGRGYVQITWKENYAKFSGLCGVDLVQDPDAALRPDIAALILFDGMLRGMFTGVALERYFNASKDDPVNARRIINGTDRAQEVADIHHDFLKALQETA